LKVNGSDQSLLDALLDSWDRNNRILVNLLQALPAGGLEARAQEGSPSVAEMFSHIHHVRLVFVSEDAPEFAKPAPQKEWDIERDRTRLAQLLDESAKTVRDAVKSRVDTGPAPGYPLRSPDSSAPAHDLARGVPSRTDKARAQGGWMSSGQ